VINPLAPIGDLLDKVRNGGGVPRSSEEIASNNKYALILFHVFISRMELENIAQMKWSYELSFRESLRIVATTPIPPPMNGNATILVGVIPEFLGVRDPAVAVISFLQEGNPRVERRSGSTKIQQRVCAPSFCITPAGTGYEYRTSDSHTSLNIAVNNSSLEEFAEREMGKCRSSVRLKECISCYKPAEMIDLFRAFIRLIRAC
jgi:hypothetical protein